jgi:acyl carrier protein
LTLKGSIDEALKLRLKTMIIKECDKNIDPEKIDDNVELFSEQSGLELDSIDALQISMALFQNFGVKLTDPKKFRRVASTINKLADFVQQE